MKYKRLGGLEVSEIGLGTWGISGDVIWGPQDRTKAIRAIHAALDAGINFFDTAEAYGEGTSETLLGEALKGKRQKAVIATKVSPEHLTYDGVIKSCERSLQRLRTDYIDLYQIHWPNRNVPLEETVAAFDRLLEEGKVREFGVCNFGVQDLEALLHLGVRCVSDQLPYSLLWRAVEYEILPFCISHGIGVLCYSPLVHGLLTGKYATADDVPVTLARTRHFSKERPMTRHGEDGCERETFETIQSIRMVCQKAGISMTMGAIAWLLSKEGVTSVLVGGRSPEQVTANVKASDLELRPEVVKELDEVTESLKSRLGPNPDMWESESRIK